jgi:hypothetical protein
MKLERVNMNKTIIILAAMITVLPCHSFGQNATNYEITINEETYDISLGRDYQAKTETGETLRFRIDKKAIMTYKNGYVSLSKTLKVGARLNGKKATLTYN